MKFPHLKAIGRVILPMLAVTLLPHTGFAQAVYGSVFGTVTDTSGAAVPNATITVIDTNKGTSVDMKSNESGEFTVSHLIPDIYQVKVTITGFKTFSQNDIHVFADQSVKVQAALEVGTTGETVNVDADEVPQLKTDRADVSTTFSGQEIVNLPIPDRNFTNLQLLLPGAQQLGWGHAASENPQGSKQIEIDGQAFAGVAFLLDGTDNQDAILGIIVVNPNPDSVSESKITTQNYDAEFGKAVASVVSAQTKSGTNKFHGAAFDYRESNANLAREPFSQGPGTFFPVGLKNQFGGAIGGPILKDKLFFFGDYQGVRQKVGISQSETVPTVHLTQTCLGQAATNDGTAGCDFSQYAAISNIYNNSSGTPVPYTDNIIPAAQVSPQFINLLKLLAPYKPNTPGQSVNNVTGVKDNFQEGGTGGLNSDQWDARLDYTLNQNIHMFGRFSRFTDTLTGSTIFGAAGGKGFGLNGYAGTSQGANNSAAAGVDVAVNSKLVFDVRLGYFSYRITTHKYDEGTNFATQLGIPGENLGDIVTSGAPGFFLQDPGQYGDGNGDAVYGQGLGFNHCNCPLHEHEDQFQVTNNWTKTLGNHAIKAGADLRYARNLRVPSDTDRTGAMYFGTGATGDGDGGTGLSFATLALGEVTNFGRYFSTSTNAKEFQKRDFFYIQDTWRARSNLTFNIGARYELYFPESINQSAGGSLLNLNTGYLQVAGVGGVKSDMNIGIANNTWNPRVGVAYNVTPNTVIRAGYGRSFDLGVFGSIFGHAATQNLPILASQALTQPGGNTATSTGYSFLLSDGPPAPAAVTTPTNGLLPNPGNLVNSHARPTTERLPTLDAWNMALQQSLAPTLSLTIAYVGNKGTHTLGDSSGQQQNPNEAGDFLPAAYSITGQPLHYDPSVSQSAYYPGQIIPGISATGGTANNIYLQRYYGIRLPACSSSGYAAAGGVNAPNGGCGWTNGIQWYGDELDTHYNALQATLTKQMAHGYSLNANYAWQQAISEATSYETWSRPAVRGRDSALRQQQIIVYGLLQLPFGHGKKFLSHANGFVNQLVSGYEISPVVNYSSGLPYTLSYNDCGSANVGSAPCYLNGNARAFRKHITGTPNGNLLWYGAYSQNGGAGAVLTAPNNGTFITPGVDQIGKLERNDQFGPHFFNTDLSVQKSFPVKEGVSLIVRADGFNAFNHINWSTPNGNIQNGGGISSGPFPNGSANPRQLQFSGRVQF